MSAGELSFNQIATLANAIQQQATGVASIALGYAACEQPVAKPRRDGYIIKV